MATSVHAADGQLGSTSIGTVTVGVTIPPKEIPSILNVEEDATPWDEQCEEVDCQIEVKDDQVNVLIEPL